MLAGTENFTKVTVKSKWVLANASKNTTFCSFSGKGSNLFRLLLCSHKKRRTTYFNWKTFSAFLFPTNAAFQKSQIQTELSAFASLPLQRTKIKGGEKRTQRLFSLHRKSISLSRVHTSVLHLFNRFPWDQFPQNLSTWIQRLGRHCHSYRIFSSPQASPGRGRARPAPAPLPRQRCGDTRTLAQTHTQNQLCLLCPRGQRCPNSYQLRSLLLLSRLPADRLERLSWRSDLPAASRAPAPPSGPGNRSGQLGGVAGGRTRTTAVRSAARKWPGTFSGEPKVWPCRGRSWRVASTSPPQRSAVGDYLRVTQQEPPTSALSLGPGQPGPGSVPLPPHGRPSPGPGAAAGVAQPRALSFGCGHALRAAQAGSRRASGAPAPAGPDLPVPFSIDLTTWPL